jgi:hypothetical protein
LSQAFKLGLGEVSTCEQDEERDSEQEPQLPWIVKDGQNGHPTRPQPMATPQAYPLGYVEDVVEVRTQLGTVFTILMISG